MKRHLESNNLIVYSLLFISFFLFLGILYIARSILIPFSIAVILAYLLYPVVTFLNRHRVPYGLAIFIVVVVMLAIFFFAGVFLVGQVNSFAQNLPDYLQGLQPYIQKASDGYNNLLSRLGDKIPALAPTQSQSVSISGLIGNLVSQLFSTLLSIISFFSNFFLIIFILVFILIDTKMFKKKLVNAWGEKNKAQAAAIIVKLNQSIQGFLVIRTLINIALAVVVTLVLLLLGVDYAYIWGPLTGLLNFIPYIGACVAAIPPILVSLATQSTLAQPIAVGIAYLVIQNVEGNFLSPKLIGDRINLNSLTVLLSLIIWGFIWGPIGMIISTPLTTCFKIICDNVELLKPIGILLGGKAEPEA